MSKLRKETGFSKSRLSRIDAFLQEQYVDTGRIAGCQALVARHGHVAYDRCFGAMDLARGKPWADDTIVRIYSMTKPIVSVALMMLYERGLFQLDEPVTRALPEWKDMRVWVSGEGEAMETREPHRPISYRDVLSHTSGLTYGGPAGADRRLRPQPPGGRRLQGRQGAARGDARTWTPSSASWASCRCATSPARRGCTRWPPTSAARWCSALSGKPLGVFLREEIFAPLGMEDTGFHLPPEKAWTASPPATCAARTRR